MCPAVCLQGSLDRDHKVTTHLDPYRLSRRQAEKLAELLGGPSLKERLAHIISSSPPQRGLDLFLGSANASANLLLNSTSRVAIPLATA
jgi:hypothetical protein